MKEDFKNYFSSLIKDIKEINKDNLLEFIKKRGKLLLTLILALFLLIGFMVGRANTSKEYILSKLEVALKNESSSKLSSIVKFDGEKVKKKDLEPLINYYNGDKSKVDSIIARLKTEGETEDFKLTAKEKLYGTKYYIEIKSYDLEVKSDFEEGKFTIDEKEYINSGMKLSNLIPGLYTVQGVLESDYGNIKASKEVILMKNESMEMDFDAVNINITSTYDDGEVFINDENTGILVKDAKNLGPFPTNGEVKVHIEKDFPWGRIKGEDVVIKDIPNINLNITMENETMKVDIKDVVDKFYTSVFLALNEEDKSKIEGATKETINKIYEVLEKKYIFLKNKYEIKDIEIVDDKNQYRYENGIYSATIVVKVDYSVRKSFLGFNKQEESKMFFTRVFYHEGEWKIQDVENFNL